ncbi:MAG TPA: ATP-binding cassette domain-containing protein [Crocinitomicaceae bacterium]|nr:ATP-binding cassette domain-containing protein [Crocinitomicaceae bacterium]
MQIKLNKIMPKPLASIQHGEKSIWGNEIELNNGKKILLNASSGKGKSTFATTVFGLRNDYEGTITYDDVDIKTLSVDDWTEIRKSKISVVFQDLQLFPKLSVKENLLLKNSLTDTFTEKELLERLELLEIENKWEQKCGLLSMGQQQRVAIIRALAQPFKWLVMDEPFSHLDEENTQRCLKLIDKRATDINAGFVLTTLGDDHSFNFDQELNL